MKIYHGTGQETTPFTMYFTADIEVAKLYALGLDDSGNFHKESFIYSTEIDPEDISIEEDFEVFDGLAYSNPELCGYRPVVFNPESGYYIVKNPALKLESKFINE